MKIAKIKFLTAEETKQVLDSLNTKWDDQYSAGFPRLFYNFRFYDTDKHDIIKIEILDEKSAADPNNSDLWNIDISYAFQEINLHSNNGSVYTCPGKADIDQIIARNLAGDVVEIVDAFNEPRLGYPQFMVCIKRARTQVVPLAS